MTNAKKRWKSINAKQNKVLPHTAIAPVGFRFKCRHWFESTTVWVWVGSMWPRWRWTGVQEEETHFSSNRQAAAAAGGGRCPNRKLQVYHALTHLGNTSQEKNVFFQALPKLPTRSSRVISSKLSVKNYFKKIVPYNWCILAVQCSYYILYTISLVHRCTVCATCIWHFQFTSLLCCTSFESLVCMWSVCRDIHS